MVNWKIFNGTPDEWDQQLLNLQGTFYQTFGWGEVKRISGWNPLRLVAKSNETVVSVVSILTKRKGGVAICWIPDGSTQSIPYLNSNFHRDLTIILKTHLIYCRISFLKSADGDDVKSLLEYGWKRPKVKISSGLTMLYELSEDRIHRLKKTSGNWRHNLKRSSRYNLKIEYWEDPNADEISILFREMELLKSLPVQHSDLELKSMISCLKKNLVIFRCLNTDGELLAIRAAGIFGDNALDLLAASGSKARKIYATHATLWELLDWCHENGLKYYDLSGVDPINNKGVFDFKHGTGAHLIECLGEWESSTVPFMPFLINFLISKQAKH